MIDEWSGLADLLANLIEKYASDLGIEDMPNPALEIGIKNRKDVAGNPMKSIVENETAA